MNESGMRTALTKKLRAVSSTSHIIAVENDILAGTPDVNGCIDGFEFWLELKIIADWPVRSRTPVRIHHFTKEQKLFLRTRWRAGGAAFLLLKVASTREWLLFCGPMVREVGQTATRKDLERLYEEKWINSLDAKELLAVMKEARNG